MVKSVKYFTLIFAFSQTMGFADELITATQAKFPEPTFKADGKAKLLGFDAEVTPARVQVGGVASIRIKPEADSPSAEDLSHYKATVSYDQVEFALTSTKSGESGWLGVFGIPLNNKLGPYSIHFCLEKEEPKSEKKCSDLSIEIINRPAVSLTEALDIEDKKVIPSDAQLVTRMIKEEEHLNEIFDNDSSAPFWMTPFERPVPQSISSEFAIGRFYQADPRHRVHWGIDFRSPIGTPVKAAQTGTVVFIGDLFFSGKTVVLDHGSGIFTLYGHLQSVKIHEKDSVKKGEVLGQSGKTGKATGPLLHWQAVVHRVKVDPLQLVNQK